MRDIPGIIIDAERTHYLTHTEEIKGEKMKKRSSRKGIRKGVGRYVKGFGEGWLEHRGSVAILSERNLLSQK